MRVARRMVQLKSGLLHFKACRAADNGGALTAQRDIIFNGTSIFEECSSGNGGSGSVRSWRGGT